MNIFFIKLCLLFLCSCILVGNVNSSYGQVQKNSNKDIYFQGGTGNSITAPVIIKGAKNHLDGIAAEYIYLNSHFKTPDVDWKLIKQNTLRYRDKFIDLIEIELADGTKKNIYFDITNFFGKY